MNHPRALLRRFTVMLCLVALVPGMAAAGPATPEGIGVTGFRARPGANAITVEWSTSTELDLASFALYRATVWPGEWGEPIYQVAAAGGVEPMTYRYVDMAVAEEVTYHYLLRVINVEGGFGDVGPVSAQAGKPVFLPLVAGGRG